MRHSKSTYFLRRQNKLVIPDLVSDCPFKLRLNPNGPEVGAQSDAWLYSQGSLGARKFMKLRGLKCGLLSAMTYPVAPANELRVVCDFLSFLFHLDDLSDDMNNSETLDTRKLVIGSIYDPGFAADTKVGRMARDIWARMSPTASKGAKARFISTFDLFFRAVSKQAVDRRSGVIMDLDSYIVLRRDTSGCKPCWALIEYANGLDLPDFAMQHEAVETLGEATNDIVSWSNDIFSYSKEDAREDTHNMIFIAMHTMGLSLQEAVDFVGDLCDAAISRFLAAKRRVPSFDRGGRIDREIALYVRGLEDWIVGSLHWSFESARYFGKEGRGVKRRRVVKLTREDKSGSTTINGSLWSRILCHTGSMAKYDLA
ncbi:terpenoid synthase [Fomitiporia mediterranea MF3/22]|uniref:terpenoid synthase n=1 Tax=Fomitiporia mediterranea (strain MF3/22) TaxID=694068 RepID=UPI00044091CE|nr:terpenoid synthase [Fomitiporia mediterranea MF3/22]EJC98233.1 terpenoid synthase [Fomitiporia mediterranea MF3/22]